MNNNFDDDIFGAEFELAEPSQDVRNFMRKKSRSPAHDPLSSSPTQQNQQSSMAHSKSKGFLKRQASLNQSQNIKGKHGNRSIALTFDNSEVAEFENNENTQNNNLQNKLKPLTDSLTSLCPLCRGEINQTNCFMCKGQGSTCGNDNFPKFFQYVMEFKMGTKASYENRKTREVKKPKVNQFCGDFFQSQQLAKKSQPSPLRLSVQQNIQRPSVSFEQYKQKILRKSNVHENYSCDFCQASPIVGSRFHCNDSECQNDYDLCSVCYFRNGHHHQMLEVKETAIASKMEAITKFLGQKGCKGRQNIRTGVIQSSIH